MRGEPVGLYSFEPVAHDAATLAVIRGESDDLWQRVRNDRTLTGEVGDRAAGWLGLPPSARGSDREQARGALERAEMLRSQQ